MVEKIGSPVRISLIIAGIAALAACATPAPAPPSPPPSAAPQASIPYRPLPPGGASYVMEIPRVGPDGVRRTIHTGISDDELVWHFRSGWNVAALNCSRDRHQAVVDAYSAYITDHSRALRQVNSRLERNYLNAAHSRREGIRSREERMTMVYNFFALPPARVNFCRAALDISTRAATTPVKDPIAFARDNFHLLVAPFEDFFARYEEYERASSEWDAKWGERYGHSQPGYVAVQAHKARNGGGISSLNPTSTMAGPQTLAASTVLDPETGAAVPVVPVSEGTVSIPVVEPVPNRSRQ